MLREYPTKAALLAVSAIGFAFATPALAQASSGKAEGDTAESGNDIIVTAQRMEQRLQDVPISITVLDNTKIANNNITSPKDIATYTPGLQVNSRFGVDNTTWTIRGFTQEQRTAPTVGTYFNDVVALRGGLATQGGDGAGPGQLFDLQNIQVLKGPQGTLFGRNSTGGAVILTPKKPTDRLEGYIEGSVGDYSMYRVQAVANIPLADTFKVRLGLDRMKRDGYLVNVGKIGFGPNGDAGGSVDYWAARLGILGNLTPNLENYAMFTYTRSKSTGVIPKIGQCFLNSPYPPFNAITGLGTSTGAFGIAACAQKAREDAVSPWAVSNSLVNQKSNTEQWQVINTTTWDASDTLRVKNIFGYGEFRGNTNLDLFGLYIPYNVTPDQVTNAGQVFNFSQSQDDPVYGNSNAESSMVEELQFQGHSSDSRLIWQAGVYFEWNNPLGPGGSQSPQSQVCFDPTTFTCLPAGTTISPGNVGNPNIIQLPALTGLVTRNSAENTFRGKALYAQATYKLTDQLELTAGLRYTWDSMRARFEQQNITMGSTIDPQAGSTIWATCTNTPTFGPAGSATNPRFNVADRFSHCWQEHHVTSSAPTWRLNLSYKPSNDVMIYAKWDRGYRQGGVNDYGSDPLQDYGPEKVDTYEVGAKTSWRGSVPGYFNISGFYNNFRNQQLQLGMQCSPAKQTAGTCTGSATAILNAGKSRLYGLEVEAGINPFQGFQLQVSYAYLNSKLEQIVDLIPLIQSYGLPFDDFRPIPVGSQIPYTMPHKVVLSANYTFPLAPSVGKVTIGGTFVYQSSMRVTTDPFKLDPVTLLAAPPLQYGSSYGVVPSATTVNLNVNWSDVAGMPIDAAFFITNLTNEVVYLSANVSPTRGFVSNVLGEPRMFGFRLKYRFGD